MLADAPVGEGPGALAPSAVDEAVQTADRLSDGGLAAAGIAAIGRTHPQDWGAWSVHRSAAASLTLLTDSELERLATTRGSRNAAMFSNESRRRAVEAVASARIVQPRVLAAAPRGLRRRAPRE